MDGGKEEREQEGRTITKTGKLGKVGVTALGDGLPWTWKFKVRVEYRSNAIMCKVHQVQSHFCLVAY